MSLLAWYPLNNSIDNQGVGDSTYDLAICSTLATPTLTSVGKVTKYCFNTNISSSDNSKASNYHSTTAFTPPDTDVTISCWFKPTSSSGGTQHILQIGGGDYRGSSGTDSTPVGLGIRLSNLTLFLNMNGASYSTGKTLTVNTWYHCAITINSDSLATVYLNGESVYTRTKTNPFNSAYIVIGSLYVGSYYTFYGSINDARYYDECLSPRQIKELSKGLCLHYKLSRGGANLFKNTASTKSWTSSSTTYVDSNFSQETITPAANSYYTMSFDAKASEAGSYFYNYFYNNNSGRQCDSTKIYKNGTLISTTTSGDGSTGAIALTTSYQHFTIVRHFNTNTTALTKQNVFRIMGKASYTVYIKNAKLEEGDHETSWLPNSADTLYSSLGLGDLVEYDCSGYKNHGTINGTVTYSNDTPRYEGSNYFTGGVCLYKIPDPILSSATEYTISTWFKLDNITSTMCIWNGRTTTGASCAIFVINATLRIDDSNMTTISAGLTANTWYHICVTWKSGGSKITYLNGNAISTVTAGTLSKSNTWGSIGRSSAADSLSDTNYLSGYISDFRIYNTALSASDVKQLYNTPATLCNNGTLLIGEVIEK